MAGLVFGLVTTLARGVGIAPQPYPHHYRTQNPYYPHDPYACALPHCDACLAAPRYNTTIPALAPAPYYPATWGQRRRDRRAHRAARRAARWLDGRYPPYVPAAGPVYAAAAATPAPRPIVFVEPERSPAERRRVSLDEQSEDDEGEYEAPRGPPPGYYEQQERSGEVREREVKSARQ